MNKWAGLRSFTMPALFVYCSGEPIDILIALFITICVKSVPFSFLTFRIRIDSFIRPSISYTHQMQLEACLN